MFINNYQSITETETGDNDYSPGEQECMKPVVGVLTTRSSKSNKPYPSGKKARLFKELIYYGNQKNIFIFFFASEGINWKEKTIEGYTYGENKKWQSGVYPFPDIVYNRILNRQIEEKKAIKLIIKRFTSDKNICFFNTRFLDKWEVHKAISNSPEGQQFLPETVLLSRRKLKDFTTRYRELFLKPRRGYRGKGVIKLKHFSGNVFQYACAGLPSIKWQKCSSFDLLYKQIKKIIKDDKRYILQQAIDLCKYEGRIFDIRAQVQKNGRGIWAMTGAAVRVAEKNRFVTHISNGGTAASYEKVIDAVCAKSDEMKAEINSQLRKVCVLIPWILEKELGLTLAVLTLDIGLDSNGKLWIIEVNSKPGSFDEDDIRIQHLQNLVDFFIFAARSNN